MKKETAEKILNETEAGYDLISGKFSATRKHFWRGLEWIGDYAQDGDKILDFGCGNGRLLELFNEKKIDYLGLDVSQKLIEIAQGKYTQENIKFQKISGQSTLPHTKATSSNSGYNMITEPVEELYSENEAGQRLVRGKPFSADYFNTAYSIAVFHHLPGRELRNEIAKEIYRTLKPGGRVVITVWNLFQPKYLKNLLSNWLSKLKGESDLDWNDCQISFTDNQGQVFQRYHHAFTKRELENLFEQAGFEVEKCEVIDRRNIILIGRKLPSGESVLKLKDSK